MSRNFQQLLTDFNTAKRLSAEATAPIDEFLTARFREKWTLEEIEIFASDFIELTRHRDWSGFDEWLRSYWADWTQKIADYKSKAKFLKLDEKILLSLTPAAAEAALPRKIEETDEYKKAVQVAAANAGRLKKAAKDI